MIISNSRRFIFVHVQKCAGTSIETALESTVRWNDVALGSTPDGNAMNGPYRRRFGLHKHSSAADIRAVVGVDVWEAYFTFAFVRDPVARAVSTYRYFKARAADGSPERRALDEGEGFSGFIRSAHLKNSKAFRPQVEMLSDPADGSLLPSFIGRLERLEADWRQVCLAIGVDAPLPHENQTDGEGDMEVVKADRDFLRDLFLADVEIFGY